MEVTTSQIAKATGKSLATARHYSSGERKLNQHDRVRISVWMAEQKKIPKLKDPVSAEELSEYLRNL